jgi:hypothetical protein
LQALRVLDSVIFHKTAQAKLSKKLQHDLNDNMERAFNHCKALVEEDESHDDKQMEKMPPVVQWCQQRKLIKNAQNARNQLCTTLQSKLKSTRRML